METRSTICPAVKRWMKKIWAMQPLKEMVLCSLRKSTIILGVAKEAWQMSTKERFPKRKYIGECSLLSKVTMRIIRRFPSTMTTYNTEKKTKKKSWSSWELESPSNTNSDTTEELTFSMDPGCRLALKQSWRRGNREGSEFGTKNTFNVKDSAIPDIMRIYWMKDFEETILTYLGSWKELMRMWKSFNQCHNSLSFGIVLVIYHTVVNRLTQELTCDHNARGEVWNQLQRVCKLEKII